MRRKRQQLISYLADQLQLLLREPDFREFDTSTALEAFLHNDSRSYVG
ncbi:MAG: hypothetical protein R3C28_11640 [Pirellulaceae bacterium]